MPTHSSRFLNNHDRRLALSFGAIVLLLMLTASGIASYLFTQLNRREEDRLSATIATILAESIARVSFSGKYHARQFVEEMQSRLPELAFISVETREGQILAHSQPEKNDTWMEEKQDADLRLQSLAKNTVLSQECLHDGMAVKEVVLPYRSGLDNEVSGVVRIGVEMGGVYKDQQATLFSLITLIIILTLAAIWGVMLLSHYFGNVHRILAAQLQGIMAHAPISISISNQQGQILASSGQFDNLFGRPTAGQNMRQLLETTLSAVNVQHLDDIDATLFASGRQSDEEMEVDFREHPQVWHISKFPITHDAIGKPTLICTFMHDITDRKQAERKILDAKEQWEKTFDAIDDIVTIHDPDMRILRANKAASDLLGATPAELIGKHCYEVFRGATSPCEDCPEVLAHRDLINHRGNVCHQNLQKTFETASFPIIDDNGYSGTVHIAKDITRSLLMERQLKQAQKMEAIGTLAGGIAHDFNNILTPILGYTEIAQTKISADNPLIPDLQQISMAALRAKDLVQQILAFSRQGAYEKKPLQPHLILKEALKLLRSTLPTTIEFKTSIATNCGTIMADPTQFHQIIMNLCTNAYHAMEKTGGTLGVSLGRIIIDEDDHKVASSEIHPGEYILLTVSDTGCGMDHQTMERIFEPYFTTKDSDKGTGLGLSMVHGIVKSYQGHITVYSEPGKGTDFKIYLPRIASPAATAETILATPLPLGTEHILVVDDEEIIISMLQSILTGLGYKATISSSSLEALALIEQDPGRFDLIITDMTMPHLTGIELAQKTLAIRPDMPIILCTGFSELINKEQARAIGIRAYLMKPVSVRELAMTVRQILEQNTTNA